MNSTNDTMATDVPQTAPDFMQRQPLPDFTQPLSPQGDNSWAYGGPQDYSLTGQSTQSPPLQQTSPDGSQVKSWKIKGEDLRMLPGVPVLDTSAAVPFRVVKTPLSAAVADPAANGQTGGGSDPGAVSAPAQGGGSVASQPDSSGTPQPGPKVNPQTVAGSPAGAPSGGAAPPPDDKVPDADGAGAVPGDSAAAAPDTDWKPSNGEDGKSVKWQDSNGNKYEFRRATDADVPKTADEWDQWNAYMLGMASGNPDPSMQPSTNPDIVKNRGQYDWYLFKNGVRVPEIGSVDWQSAITRKPEDLWGAWDESGVAHHPFTPPDQKQTPPPVPVPASAPPAPSQPAQPPTPGVTPAAPVNPPSQETAPPDQAQTPAGTPDADPRFPDTKAVIDAYHNHSIDAATARSEIAKLAPKEAQKEVDQSYDDANKKNTGVAQNFLAHAAGGIAKDVGDDFGVKTGKNEGSRYYGASPDLDNSWESKGGDIAGYVFAEVAKAIALKKVEGMGKAGKEIAEWGPKITSYVKAYNEGYDESIKNQQERGMAPDVNKARRDGIASAMNSAGVDLLGELGENGIIGSTEKAISRSEIAQKIEKAMNESGIVQKVRSELPILVPRVSSVIKKGVHYGVDKANELAKDAIGKVEDWFEYGPKPSEQGEATPTPSPQHGARPSQPQARPQPHPTPRPVPAPQAFVPFPPHLDWTRPAAPDDTGMA